MGSAFYLSVCLGLSGSILQIRKAFSVSLPDSAEFDLASMLDDSKYDGVVAQRPACPVC